MQVVSSRRKIITGGAAAALCQIARPGRAMADWEPIAPQEAGFVPDLGARIDDAVRTGKARNVHAVVVVRHGRLVVERYYAGRDEILGKPFEATFGPDVLHDVRSVTKSMVGVLYGIALAAGKVPAPEAPLLAQFPEYADLGADPRRRRWTIAHALTMTLGIEWNEGSDYRDPANSETLMYESADRWRFTLGRPIVTEPGERWTYCGGATELIARLITKGTGLTLSHYARAALFDPLGVRAFEWREGTGRERAAAGLRLSPRDLARVGRMVLDGGSWEGQTVVPAAWLETSLAAKILTDPAEPDGRRYGYHWYLLRAAGARVIAAIGNGGQRLFLLPSRDLIVAINAGNYNLADQAVPPNMLLRDVILPNLAA
jgi:CubicO group peptidase (beta-lactamase class C family)